jgi:hypothetical protein
MDAFDLPETRLDDDRYEETIAMDAAGPHMASKLDDAFRLEIRGKRDLRLALDRFKGSLISRRARQLRRIVTEFDDATAIDGMNDALAALQEDIDRAFGFVETGTLW